MAQPKLLEQYRERLRVKHYSLRTEDAYLHWARRFICFHGKRHPREMGGAEVEAFLSHLATEGRVAPSTQNQALARREPALRDRHAPAGGTAPARQGRGFRAPRDHGARRQGRARPARDASRAAAVRPRPQVPARAGRSWPWQYEASPGATTWTKRSSSAPCPRRRGAPEPAREVPIHRACAREARASRPRTQSAGASG